MRASKHRRLGALVGPAISLAKKHRVSVDAMMAAACNDTGPPAAVAAATEFLVRFPAAKQLGWKPLAPCDDHVSARAKSRARRLKRIEKVIDQRIAAHVAHRVLNDILRAEARVVAEAEITRVVAEAEISP